MLLTLVQKEISETVLDLRFTVTTLLFVVFIPLGMYVSCKDYERRLENYQWEHQTYRDQYAHKVDHAIEAQGFRPPSVLSVLAMGLDPFVPSKVITSRLRRFTVRCNTLTSNPMSLILGKADFLFNMTFVVSLAALILSFNAVSGERETGTLRLLIAGSVPRGQILLAKILGRTLALVIPWLLSVLLAMIVLEASPVVSLRSSEIWPALWVVLGGSLSFILGMVCLGVCISTFSQKSMVSMVLAFFAWMLFVVAIPRVSPLIAGILYPIEGQAVVDLTMRITEDDIDREFEREASQAYHQCIAEFEVSTEGSEPSLKQRYESRAKAKAKYAEEICPPLEKKYRLRTAESLHRIEQDYRNRQGIQTFIAKTLSRFSPVSCYTYVVTEIAGTGLTELRDFLAHAQRYQDEIKETIYDKAVVTRTGGGYYMQDIEGVDFAWSKAVLPDMVYHYPTLAEALHTVWPDILLLGLFNVLFFVLAFVGFNRYDVR